jgi:transposase
MFIRLTKSRSSKNPTVQIVESFREGKIVRQKIIASLGVVRNQADRERLINMGHALIAKLSLEQNPQSAFDLLPATSAAASKEKNINPRDLIHVRNQPCGFEDVFGELSGQIGFTELLNRIDLEHRNDFSCKEIIQFLVQKRIEEPASKRRSLYLETQEKGALPCALHQVYRAMDTISPFVEQFQNLAHLAAEDLLDRKIECYFYDATTLYFESVLTDEVREFGFSKDGKFIQVQVLFCLLVTELGLPVGYEIFSGNTAETKTLKTAIENLSKRFNVVRATIVCDRGMLSKDNLDFAEGSGQMNYIIGEKLRKLPAAHQEIIFDKSTYESFGEALIKDVSHPTRKGARLVLVYSESRAKKDKQDRERLLKKLRKKLEKKAVPKDFISNAGVKKIVRADGGTASLNLEAIAKEEKWDGFFGIVTNHETLSQENVLAQYRGLWQVEASFRLAKHNLETRPIFHWSPHRIKAHILICFLSLVLERHLEVRLKKSSLQLTSQNIHDALGKCQKVILQDRRSFRLFELDSNKPKEAKQIYEAVGLPWRKPTKELETPEGLVVSSVGSVIPQTIGIAPL